MPARVFISLSLSFDTKNYKKTRFFYVFRVF